MSNPADDPLQRRIARLVDNLRAPRSVNGMAAAFIGTTIGMVRKQNQDRALFLIAAYPRTPERNFALAILSDGMGGLVRGDEAAVSCLSVFASRVLRTPKLHAAERLRSAAMYANEFVHQSFDGRAGATLSAVMVDHCGAMVGTNIGDSRVYGITIDRQAIQLSKDDTLAGYLGEGGNGGPRDNRLVQFVGMGDGIEPHIVTSDRSDIDTVLLTSDGIHGTPPDAFARVIKESAPGSDLVRRLLTLSDIMGGRDNGTVVTMPIHFNGDANDGDQGLNITIYSASERLEVWIPVLVNGMQSERVAPALMEATDASPSPPPISSAPPNRSDIGTQQHASLGVKPPKKWRKRGAKAASRQRASQKAAEADRPALDIKFPNS